MDTAEQKIVRGETSLYDRVPPQAIEAERAVLGSVMLDNEALGRVVELLSPDAFYKTAHQHVFQAAVRLFEKNEPVDLITLSDELRRMQVLDEVGGVYYLTELSESVPSAANVEYHARIVYEKYLLRRLITESANIAKACYEPVDDVFDLLDRAEQGIFRLAENRMRNTFQHIEPIMHLAMEKIESFHQRAGMVTGVTTGFPKLDELTSGFQNGELIIVAGRPSMGKTAFCLNIARNASVLGKTPVGIFSLEMSREQLALRLLCAEARIDAHALRTGTLADHEWKKLSTCVGILAEAPIFIDDTPGMGVLEMRAKARRLKKEKGLGLLIIDYLQLMQGPKNAENRQQEISAISRSLKALAKELSIPVVALSQLSRAVEVRGGERRPVLSDLRESGAIEQDADMVIFIYRPDVYGIKEEDGQSIEGRAEIIIGKQRNGPTGTVYLSFIRQWTKFETYAPEQEPPF